MTPQMTRLETESATPAGQELSFKDRQGLAMGWAFRATFNLHEQAGRIRRGRTKRSHHRG